MAETISINEFAAVKEVSGKFTVEFLLSLNANTKPCNRCGGEGGSRAWLDYACYKCNGSGRIATVARKFDTKAQAQAYAQTSYDKHLAAGNLPQYVVLDLPTWNGNEAIADAKIIISDAVATPKGFDLYFSEFAGWLPIESAWIDAACDVEDEGEEEDIFALLNHVQPSAYAVAVAH